MVGFHNLVGTGIAPVSKKAAVISNDKLEATIEKSQQSTNN